MGIDWDYERSRCAFPEPVSHNGDDTRPMPSASTDRDADLERDWHWLCAELREFTAKHGLAGMLRCVADSVREQK